MIITHRNWKLRTIALNDPELIRYWRIRETVNNCLADRISISTNARLNWFKSFSSPTSIYFIIHIDRQEVGYNCTYPAVDSDNFNALDLDRKLDYSELSREPSFIKK